MHDYVKVCLMPIDQLPRIASVSQTSGFGCLNNSTKFICGGLVVSQTIQKQLKWLPGKVFSKFYFYLLFFNLQIWPANLTCKFDLQIWPANSTSRSTCRFNLLNLQIVPSGLLGIFNLRSGLRGGAWRKMKRTRERENETFLFSFLSLSFLFFFAPARRPDRKLGYFSSAASLNLPRRPTGPSKAFWVFFSSPRRPWGRGLVAARQQRRKVCFWAGKHKVLRRRFEVVRNLGYVSTKHLLVILYWEFHTQHNYC